MKQEIKILAAFATALFASAVLAEDVYVFNATDSTSTPAITNAAKWKCGTVAAGTEGERLASDKVFAVSGNKALYTLSSSIQDTVFTGGRLELGNAAGSQGHITQYTYGNARTSWDNWGSGDGLKLIRGKYSTGVASGDSHIYGKMEVVNYRAAIWEFALAQAGARLYLHSDISSAMSGGGNTKDFKITSAAADGAIFFEGSLANFYGDILTETTGSNSKTIGFGTTTLANRLQLCENCTLTTASATNVFTLGKLECNNIAGIDVKMELPEAGSIRAGQIVITNSVTVENGPVVVKTSYAPVTNLTANATLKPLVFGRDVAFNKSDFAWTPADEMQKAALSASFVEEEDGSTSLAVDSGALVTQTTTDSSYVSITGGGVYRESSLTNASHWSDGEVPHPGAHYLVQSKALRTPLDAMLMPNTPFDPIDYAFPGQSLAIGNGSTFIVSCSNVTVRLLRFFDGSSFMQAQYTAATLNGKVSVEGATTWKTYRGTSGDLLTVKSEVRGDGEIKMVSANASASGSAPAGQMLLDNANTNFTGRICVSFNDGATPNYTTVNMTLNIKDGRALGGAGTAFDPKALTLERYGSLCALESTTVSEPTRGTWINGVGRIKVESGKTLTYTAPLAVYGTFCKEGAGLIALGNAQPKFGETALDTTPDATAANRTFLVREGNVKVMNAYALNGLDVVVEDPDATILLDADTEDATLATYGIVNTLTPGTSFAVSGSAAKIKVGFTCAEKPAWTSREIAICTVKASEAGAVAALLEKTEVESGCKLKLESITPVPVMLDDVSCVTLRADVSAQRGFCLIYR